MTKFSPEFRQTVIERVRSGESQTEVAKSLGISSKTVHGWWSAAKQDLPTQELTDTEEIAFLKSSGVLRQTALKKYAYLKKCLECSEIGRHFYLPLVKVCCLLEVSVSGFYSWKSSDPNHRNGIVHTDDFIVTTIKAFIKDDCYGHTPGLLTCYRFLREQQRAI